MEEIRGKVWLFPDNIDTDLIVPGQYLDAPVQEIMQHVFESIRPDFAKTISKNDIIIAGVNFGCGSSRENAASVLKELGIGCVIAESFGRIFFRNAIAIGLPVLTCRDVAQNFSEGDLATVEVKNAAINNTTKSISLTGNCLSEEMINILEKGGILEYLADKGDESV